MIDAVFGSVSVTALVRIGVDLLLPASSFDRGEFFFRHSMPSREIACHARAFSPITARFPVSVGVMEKLTCSDFCVYFYPGICGNPRLWKLDSFVDRNAGGG